jgi:hypothetical protein
MSWKGDMIKAGIIPGDNGSVKIVGELEAQNVMVPPANVYYVDQRVTTSGDGRTWDDAFDTIAEAITASNDDITWSDTPWNVDNWILIAQGEYAEALTSLPYSAHMVGMGNAGTDGAVEIHPASGACMAGTGLDLTIFNIRFEVTGATPALDFGICNNVIIEHCEIVCGIAGTGTHGISTENATHLQVRNCSFQFGGASGGWDYGIYAAGGANKYLHHCRIEDNEILGLDPAGTGIFIQNTCTASNTVIARNIIVASGAGTGIDCDYTGSCYLVDNRIIVGSGGDAIAHAGGNTKMVGNIVNLNGTCAYEPTGP